MRSNKCKKNVLLYLRRVRTGKSHNHTHQRLLVCISLHFSSRNNWCLFNSPMIIFLLLTCRFLRWFLMFIFEYLVFQFTTEFYYWNQKENINKKPWMSVFKVSINHKWFFWNITILVTMHDIISTFF